MWKHAPTARPAWVLPLPLAPPGTARRPLLLDLERFSARNATRPRRGAAAARRAQRHAVCRSDSCLPAEKKSGRKVWILAEDGMMRLNTGWRRPRPPPEPWSEVRGRRRAPRPGAALRSAARLSLKGGKPLMATLDPIPAGQFMPGR